MPLSIMKHLVANIHFEVNLLNIGKMGIGSEVISDKDLGLLRGGSVGAESLERYISWILMI